MSPTAPPGQDLDVMSPPEHAFIAVLDPADLRRVVGRVPAMAPAEVTALYDAAADAAARWRDTSPLERARVLAAAAAGLRRRRDEIAAGLVAEMGKTRAEATVEVEKSADFFDYYAGLAREPYGYLLVDSRPGTQTSARIEPLGVVCLITPWNDPLLTPARKLAPALATGNTVILKPATETPLVALRLEEALREAGLPAGALSTVTGRASEIEAALLDDPRLAAVSFTGSNAVGQRIKRRLTDRNVRLQTEMGGKNASVVLDDADLDLAVATVAAAAFGQAGQRCTATSRVIVDRAVAGRVVEGLVRAAAAVRLGPGMDPATTMGPVVSARHRSDVLGHIGRARAQGAAVVAGGGAPSDHALAHGCYLAPTVLTDVEPTMDIWREEVFGPVVVIRVVDGFDAAVAAANDSPFGLAAAVFTTSLARAHTFADRANTGQVSVNLPTSGWDVHMPFGGFGDSGSPFKEQGLEGPRFYTRVKTVAIRHGDAQ
ncbi:aldehyde dehydrogenase family protein [Frankia sp. CNm7]|uniref:Aldehyde dehydrogenase family protein n=1 Tax=Frankia nepalensis TaxID=1836974 RepID=A0A937UT88_9ACTN|nr:aldehyde dehydrogenase family protein [Frankia nepalensis]MBL7497566.1 aldehyde dehydrogenase family protein [Frankia nepalensis]MBL7509621.1 aldehyde dehydrogenase family protein [Frankia nepalensis]MBL7517108.1 aldehyde dehydrogenase family protein [Frankia nepalensis]MBL7631020.1 aldehyde dehydrogenase family protein [Frankia nepalensis]